MPCCPAKILRNFATFYELQGTRHSNPWEIPAMNMRKITSLTSLVAFVLLLLSSVVLYIVPAGRVAYWADWRLWGLSKESWGAVHINLGVLMLIAMVFHVYYNWGSIVSYLKNKKKELRVVTADFIVSVVVTLLVIVGTLAGVPPLSSIIHLGEKISETANIQYGEPPYGHAELSAFSDFVRNINAPLEGSLLKLEQAGIQVIAPSQTIQSIAANNNIAPQALYLLIKPEVGESSAAMPETAPAGTGNRTLERLCSMYQFDVTQIIAGLAQQDIIAQRQQTMRAIAVAHSVDPHAIYAAIYAIVAVE